MPRALAEIAHQLPDAALIPFPVVSDRLRIEPWWSNGATTRLVLSEYLKYLVRQAAHAVRLVGGRREAPARNRIFGAALIGKNPFAAKIRSPLFARFYRQVVCVPSFSIHRPFDPVQRAVLRKPDRSHDCRAADSFCRILACGSSCAPMRCPACGCCASSAAPKWNGAASRSCRKPPISSPANTNRRGRPSRCTRVLADPTYVLKRELMWIPLFGWLAWKAGLIPIDRSAGVAALARMTARAQQALAAGRQIVIFPEGTRRPPGAEPSYCPALPISTASRRALRSGCAQFRPVLAAPIALALPRHHASSKSWIRSRPVSKAGLSPRGCRP
jgi:hypothetical protein